mgnify:FL=1
MERFWTILYVAYACISDDNVKGFSRFCGVCDIKMLVIVEVKKKLTGNKIHMQNFTGNPTVKLSKEILFLP